jgi:hypothetical protein
MAPLTYSPSLDELGDQSSPEGGSVAVELVVSGHGKDGTFGWDFKHHQAMLGKAMEPTGIEPVTSGLQILSRSGQG